MSTGIKLSEAQISKITQSGGSYGSSFGNLGKKTLQNVAILLARDNLPRLVSNLTSNAINKFEWKISEKKNYQSRKKIYFIYFEWRYE